MDTLSQVWLNWQNGGGGGSSESPRPPVSLGRLWQRMVKQNVAGPTEPDDIKGA